MGVQNKFGVHMDILTQLNAGRPNTAEIVSWTIVHRRLNGRQRYREWTRNSRTCFYRAPMDDDTSAVFKLGELKSRMEQLGVKHDGRCTRPVLSNYHLDDTGQQWIQKQLDIKLATPTRKNVQSTETTIATSSVLRLWTYTLWISIG